MKDIGELNSIATQERCMDHIVIAHSILTSLLYGSNMVVHDFWELKRMRKQRIPGPSFLGQGQAWVRGYIQLLHSWYMVGEYLMLDYLGLAYKRF